jgi:hypothetical protein
VIIRRIDRCLLSSPPAYNIPISEYTLLSPQSGKKFLTITPASETPASELEIIGAELGVDFKLMNL